MRSVRDLIESSKRIDAIIEATYRRRVAGKQPHTRSRLRARGVRYDGYVEFRYPTEGSPKQLDSQAKNAKDDRDDTESALHWLEQTISFAPDKAYHKVHTQADEKEIKITFDVRQDDMDGPQAERILTRLERLANNAIARTAMSHPEVAYLFGGDYEAAVHVGNLNPKVDVS